MNAPRLNHVLAAALLLGATRANAQDFSKYFSIGDSLAAGYSSNSLVETNQATSVPALIARQAGFADFQQPLVGEPGLPPQLALYSIVPSVVIAPKSAEGGQPKNLLLPRPYNNLAVPGATSIDALQTVSDDGGFHDLILRRIGTQVQQAAGSGPTFVTLWIGNNDVLGAAIRGKAIDGVTLTPPDTFRQVYTAIVGTLKQTSATIVAANLFDVTAIPFVTAVKPYVVNPATGEPVMVNGALVPLIGPSGPLPPGTFVTLAAASYLAQGVGIPTGLGGTGQPLPDEVILDGGEVAIIKDHVAQDNAAIQDICAQAAIPVVDLNAVFADVAANGRQLGGVRLNAGFLTGGIFGYDGVHPSALGYALVANEWIAVINANGGALPLVDLGPFAGTTAAAAGMRAASESEWRSVPVLSAEAYRELLRVFPLVSR